MYDNKTDTKLLKEVYLMPGIHKRELSKRMGIGMPSVDFNINKVRKLLIEKREGKHIKYFIDYSKNGIVPCLYQVEQIRIAELPKKMQFAVFDLMKELGDKPLMTIIFGSYARGNYTKDSDLDVLLVYQNLANTKDIENTAKRVGMRHGVEISPVYLDFSAFRESFHNSTKEFFVNLKKDKIIMSGIEWWVGLKNEEKT